MQKKTCPNGHVYDPSIYGDLCPMCPAPGAASQQSSHTVVNASETQFMPTGGETQVHQNPVFDGGFMNPTGSALPRVDPTGETMVRPIQQPKAAPMPQQPSTPKTVIRHVGAHPGMPPVEGRKLVGFLVTYNRNPLGKAYNLYEGRNYVGRDSSCDISVPDDSQMSGKHMSILYRNVDGKFKFRDEQSSNGTFVNKELLDDGTLENYDIIRVGSTLFIFIAIPKMG